MTEKQQRIRWILERAIHTFNRNEQYLLANDLSERCICAKFAMYLERAVRRSPFKDYITDVEYNRGMGGNDHAKKMLQGNDVTLDLIVHKRGQICHTDIIGYDNLLAIEMKKQGLDFSWDMNRLQMLVDNAFGFCYRAGFAVRIVEDAQHGVYELRIEKEYYNLCDF